MLYGDGWVTGGQERVQSRHHRTAQHAQRGTIQGGGQTGTLPSSLLVESSLNGAVEGESGHGCRIAVWVKADA